MQGIHVTAYSPMGTPPSSSMFNDYQPELVMNDPVVNELAEKYNKNVGQVRQPCPNCMYLDVLITAAFSSKRVHEAGCDCCTLLGMYTLCYLFDMRLLKA